MEIQAYLINIFMVAIYSYTSKYICICIHALYICIWVFINVYLSGLNVTKHLLKYHKKTLYS